ncbi:MAG: isocitrate/isopropylmalate dehydrogenase family protein [Candidatus Jordarchaeum sp.]|uniref:isocitrate/isopropylmalate dehydrogenase family protein n=1 Tax=Candidatus Jordarchaeum sp. TaxID=2823881 RepID=UPI004048F829
MTRTYKIIVFSGDGVGKEVVPETVKILKSARDVVTGFNLEFTEFPCGGKHYLETGKEWPDEAWDACKNSDAILFGAIGWPGAVKSGGVLAGVDILLGLRFGLDLYANLRPAKLFEGIESRVLDKSSKDVDFVVVRENTEGLYAPIRGALNRGGIEELAVDVRVITRKGAERIIRYAFNLCMRRGGAPRDGKRRVSCVDKSNVLDGCRLFRKIYDEIAKGYEEIERDYVYVDAMTQWMIRAPEHYDVVVTSNFQGDIISDLSAVLIGGMGVAPSANIGEKYGMFEPVHGSAPDIAGQQKANPIGSILSGKMMLEWLALKHSDKACKRAAQRIEEAVSKVLIEGNIRTPDLCYGKYAGLSPSKTQEVGDAILRKIEK